MTRLDRLLVERGLARSRGQARELVLDGMVLVDGHPATRPSLEVVDPSGVTVTREDPWVSRAAHKLLGALDALDVVPPARVLDAGASTGGFSQVLRSRGAGRVYAVDVGHGQLAEAVRTDPGVVAHERLNIKDLNLDHLDGEPVDLVVADLSFISLTAVLAAFDRVSSPTARWLLMVKPQFEVGRENLGAGGVVRTDDLRRAAVDRVAAAAAALGRPEIGRSTSPLPGGDGNVEYFLLLAPEHLG